MAKRRETKPVPIDELSRTFRVPSHGLPVDYPGREVLLKSRITNVGRNGLFVQTKSPFAKGSKIDVTFRLPTSEIAITASCIVRWSSADEASARPADVDVEGMGIEFSKISRRDRKAVERYIKEYLTRIRSG